jgi:hypothetical protein
MITRDLLKQHRIFDTVPKDIAEAILDASQIAPYAPGEVVVPIGQPFTFFGLILEGEIIAYLPEGEGPPRSVETLKAGSCFGEMSLLTGLDSPVDLIATTPCRVLLVPPDLFHRWVQADPVVLQVFSKSIARRSTRIEHEQLQYARAVAEREAEKDPYGLNLTPEEPQKLLVINLRTGSLKYRFFDTDDESQNVEGQVEWIGEPRATQTHTTIRGESKFELGAIDHRAALQAALDRLVDPETGVLENLGQITAVGHRVVHGGDKYSSPPGPAPQSDAHPGHRVVPGDPAQHTSRRRL